MRTHRTRQPTPAKVKLPNLALAGQVKLPSLLLAVPSPRYRATPCSVRHSLVKRNHATCLFLAAPSCSCLGCPGRGTLCTPRMTVEAVCGPTNAGVTRGHRIAEMDGPGIGNHIPSLPSSGIGENCGGSEKGAFPRKNPRHAYPPDKERLTTAASRPRSQSWKEQTQAPVEATSSDLGISYVDHSETIASLCMSWAQHS